MLRQRGHLFPWVAVCLGTGITLYFALRFDPGPLHYIGLVLLAALSLLAIRPFGPAYGPLALGIALIAFGVILAGIRSHVVAEPVLGFRYYGPVEGRIVEIDRSSRDVPRITLDRLVLDRVPPARTPARVRVSLYGDQRWLPDGPGAVVILTAHLSPPNGPMEPGDFDFRRMAWFQRLGAVGYTDGPVLTLIPPEDGLWVNRLRMTLSAAVQDRINGEAGGFAAAVMTGDRSGMSEATNQAMRDSNLYHLVSISGTHMAMLVAFVFGFIRYGVALIPPLALRVSAKKAAAAVALPVAALYLILAGRDMATERAFVMVAVMLVAILLDRQALTLRSVAIAALIILVTRPESAINPGFQMSFAASVAMIAAFQNLRNLPRPEGVIRWFMPVALLVFSSLVAGAATAPYAAAHFNRVAHFGLIANLLAVPAMGLLVMPGAAILAVTGPLGLDQPGVWMIDYGSRWILAVAAEVATWPGAVSAVTVPPDAVLPLITLGGLWIILVQGRTRFAGLALPMVALALWTTATRPTVLISETGGLIGLMTDAGRTLSKPQGDGFAAESWLENDGEITLQEDAAMRPGLDTIARTTLISLNGATLLHVTGNTALAALDGCNGADILITNVEAEGLRPCEVYDITRLRNTGALAGRITEKGLTITTSAELTGQRLWSLAAQRRSVPETAQVEAQ
ncbi:MAG: ComEC/Rec2 family competence protein [Rhodobacterales bacterium]|nr:ComEC/Rec2 family competence protein [Rhodobacterales bacterium]